ncbi:PAS domain S-box protein [Sphingobium amiense]|uniref:histidine kinase n=1 Tax=Sphingobium amiense TaxID=135719 RepID=A0A494W138_9SPHN|nr:response regulator [Sphingobium amiense]BBD97036.1 PAS domain S-box protein [Sphingobium amiense]
MLPEKTKILAVDDIEDNLTALEALLSGEGIELVKARSGAQALEMLLVEDVALALLDVQMPGMDGFELAELMRGTERTRRVPIIFLTAVGRDEQRRFRGYESGAIDYLVKPVDPDIVRAKVALFVELFRQRQELARERDQHAAALARNQAHTDNSPLAIVEFDAGQHIVSWSAGAERMFGWRASEVAGFRALELDWLDPEDAAAFGALIGEMIAGRQLRAMQPLRMRTSVGVTIDCECYCSALLDGRGRLLSVNVQILDVTERKRAEDTQRLLIGELNHRVKNTLASVQAIAVQTLRHSSGPSDFAPTFTGRIHALARAHSLLSSTTWQGASLRELIEGQLDIGTVNPTQLLMDGPELELAPELALHVALILHELVTNAHKYGALSTATGSVSLVWGIDADQLQIVWREQGGPPVLPATRKGFGTALIERSLKAEGGSARVDHAQDGIVWTLTLPHSPRISRVTPPRPKEEPLLVEIIDSDRQLAGRSVLIIEDEPLVAMEIADLLEERGARVSGIAASQMEALAAIADGGIDAALLDGNLQGRSVETVAAALAEAAIPFAFVTGYGRENLPDGFERHMILTKPFSRDALLRCAAMLFAGHPTDVPAGIIDVAVLPGSGAA